MVLRKAGLSLTLEGKASYLAGLKDINREQRLLAEQSKLAIAQLGTNASKQATYATTMDSYAKRLDVATQKTNTFKTRQAELPKIQDTIKSSMTQLNKTYQDSATRTEELKKKYDALKSAKDKDKQAIAEARDAYKSSKAETKSLGDEVKNLERAYDSNNKELKDLPFNLAKAETATQKLRNEMQRLHTEYRNAGGRYADVADKFGAISKASGTASEKIGRLASASSKISLPLIAGFGAATLSATKFTSEIGAIGPLLTNGGAITEKYQKQLDKMSDSSKNWAKQYGISTTLINNGLAEVVRKGYDANQTLGVMPSILNATKASGDEFTDVMNVTTETISQFNLKGKDYATTVKNATRVTDSLTFVANATSAGFTDLGLAMSYVGPIANSLNMSVEETSSAIGLLTDAGIGGEKAGTALRGALTRLLKPSKQNRDGFEQLGISVEDFQKGTLTLPDMLDKIKNNTNGWTDAQRTAAIALAFGTESQSAMNVLVGKGGDALRNLTKDTYGASGATKEIADQMANLPANKVERFKESIRVLGITIGEKLLPTISPLIEKATDWINAFSEMDDATQQTYIKWGLAGAAAFPVLKALSLVTGTVSTTTGGIESLVRTFGKLTTPKLVGDAVTSFSAFETGAMGATTQATAFSTSLISLPAVLGIAGAALIGWGAWELWGKDAWNAAQRTREWGSDVGKTTGETLGVVKSNLEEATGQMGLMAQGFDVNTASMVDNFQTIGSTIEKDLNGQISAFRESLGMLPEEMQAQAQKIVDNATDDREKALKIVQENNARVQQIREQAANNHRELTITEANQVKALMLQSASEYLSITVTDANDRKQVLDALTGDVSTATEEQAQAWIQSLGKQRQATKADYTEKLETYKKYLADQGILNTQEGQQLIELFEKSRDASTDAIDQQIAELAQKYPELAELINFSNGQLIDGMGEAGDAAVAENEKMLAKAKDMADALADSANENRDKLRWLADDATDYGKKWNDLVFDPKTGEVKSNVRETVVEAAKDTDTWNAMRFQLHDANLDSNAKKMIGEAAIANGWWDSMPWEEKQIILQDGFSQNIFKALEDSGKWNELSVEEKTALLYSNSKETMADTMFQLGLWDEYNPEIKDLGAENYDLLNKIAQSKEATNQYNNLDPELKTLLAKSPADLTVKQAQSLLEKYNKVPPELKKLMGNDKDVKNKVDQASVKLNEFNRKQMQVKKLNATTNAPKVASDAQSAINSVRGRTVSLVTQHINTYKTIYKPTQGRAAIANAKGTNFHPGGDMIVNDQKGSTFKELVQFPNKPAFVPEGRDVFIPNAPKGTKVLRADLTKKMFPHYKYGIGEQQLMNIASRDSVDSRTIENIVTRVVKQFSNSLKSNRGIEVNQTISSLQPLSEREVARQTKLQLQKLALKF